MKLIIVSGPPCSGKTTFIKNNYNNIDIISSDKEIFLIEKNRKDLDKVRLNRKGLDNSYKKIENNIKNDTDSIFDSTNLTKKRRNELIQICKKYNNVELEGLNIIKDFNTIYSNWENRGKDIKIEIVFFLYSIYQKINNSKLYQKIENIKYLKENNLEYLNIFLNSGKISNELLEENKDLKFLNDFWKKSGKDYFKEYNNKIEFLEDLTKEDKLALVYSEIKYFYIDFISKIKVTYDIEYNDFINLFFENIITPKVSILGLDKTKTYNSFIKIIEIF